MRRFYFDRQTDISGTSGTGAVVEGVVFSDGSVSLHWMTELSSWAQYRNIDECVAIHGHGGATNLVWVDEEPSTPREYASAYARWFKQPTGRKWHIVGNDLWDDTDGDVMVKRHRALCGAIAWHGSTFMGAPASLKACQRCMKERDRRGAT